MTWNEVRTRFPQQWVVAEAISAHTDAETHRRVVEELSVLAAFSDPGEAQRKQLGLHRSDRGREILLAFTGWETLEIEEVLWAGVRRAG